MTQEQKSQLYSNLLLQHTRLDNQINEIKAENFEMNDEQMGRIRGYSLNKDNLLVRCNN
jgi:hypothetical protein